MRGIWVVICIGILLVVGSVVCFSDDRTFAAPTVVKEETTKMEEVDITNKPLEEYMNSIEDSTKKELLKKFLYLPSELIPKDKIDIDSSLDPVEQAKILAELSNDDLKAIVDEMEANLPEVSEQQKEKHDKAMKELAE